MLTPKFEIIIPPQDIQLYPGCLQDISRGSQSAFHWLYKNYGRKIYNYALLTTSNTQASEDIVQEVFLKLWKNRESLPAVQNFNAYLNTMVRNKVNDYYRMQSQEKSYLQEYKKRVSEVIMPDTSIGLSHIISEAIEKLPAKQKLVYKLRKEHSFKREEIASFLNISPNTVKAHIQKALKFVKEYIHEEL